MTKKEFLEYCELNGAFKGDLLNASFVVYLKNRPQLLETLDSLSTGNSISEKLFNLKKKKTYCEVCGKPTAFKSYGEGYNRFCSAACRNASMNKKLEKTMLKTYGVKRPAQDPKIKAKMDRTLMKNHGVKNANELKTKPSKPNMDKVRKTNLKRYGVEHALQNKDIKNKVAKTNLEKYGNVCSLQNEEVQREMRRKHFEEYGVEHFTQREDVKEKIRQSRLKNTYRKLLKSNRLKGRVKPLFKLEEFEGVDKEYEFRCTTCGNKFESNLTGGSIPRCLICYPPSELKRNPQEDKVVEFIKTISPNETIITNDRKILKGKELDIYLPDSKLAIEFNELYFHSELAGRGRYYHLNKTKGCEEKGIQLLHIFEDEWLGKRGIVEGIISSKLGIYNKEINAKDLLASFDRDTTDFLEENHLQGVIPFDIQLSLIENEDIVASINFNIRKPKNLGYELVSFVIKKGYKINGAFEELLGRFREEYKGPIKALVERRLYNGKLYEENLFEELAPKGPSCFYSRGKDRKRKQELKEGEDFSSYKIWDCGFKVFELK